MVQRSLSSRFVQKLKRVAPTPATKRKVLPQGVPLCVIVRHEDPSKIGVMAKTDSHHVVDFAFHEVGAHPNIRERVHHTVRLGYTGLEPDSVALLDRIKFVDDFKAF